MHEAICVQIINWLKPYICLQNIRLEYGKAYNCANKWLLLNMNSYFKSYNSLEIIIIRSEYLIQYRIMYKL